MAELSSLQLATVLQTSNQADPNRQIERLSKQLETANRKIANSNHQTEANKKRLLEAKLNKELSRKEAEGLKKELSKTRERYATLEHDLQVNKLRNECAVNQASIINLQATINEINSDPGRDLPIKVDNKRRLPKLMLELQRLKSKHESQSQLLENVEAQGDMNLVMQEAASKGDKIMVKRLLARGIQINIPDESGYTAFMYACGQGGHAEIVDLMISVGDATVNDCNELSKATPLILAANNSHNDVIEMLLRHGAGVDQRDDLGCTPLLIACAKNSTNCAKTLLGAGANPNALDRRSNSALHHCAIHGNVEMAQLLMDKGANGLMKNNELMTAIGKLIQG